MARSAIARSFGSWRCRHINPDPGSPGIGVQALNEATGSASLRGTPAPFTSFANAGIAKWRGAIQREGQRMDVG